MVGGFDPDDAIADLRVLLAQIFGKFGLRAGRADDQDFAGVADGVQHLCEKLLVEADMAAADRIGLVVKVSCGHMRVQGYLIAAGQADVEDLGLGMVDPDDGVEVGWHVRSFLNVPAFNVMSGLLVSGKT
jgi:hypothetical protein